MPSFRFIHYTGRCVPLLMVTSFVGFISDNIWAERISVGSFGALFILGGYGALLGLKGVRGSLFMKCPFCPAKGRFAYSKNLGGHLECDHCGVVRGSGLLKARLVCGKLNTAENHEEHATMSALSPARTIGAAPPNLRGRVCPARPHDYRSLVHSPLLIFLPDHSRGVVLFHGGVLASGHPTRGHRGQHGAGFADPSPGPILDDGGYLEPSLSFRRFIPGLFRAARGSQGTLKQSGEKCRSGSDQSARAVAAARRYCCRKCSASSLASRTSSTLFLEFNATFTRLNICS